MPKLSKTPSVRTFTEAWTRRFEQVVKDAAGKDGRLSRSEAQRIAQRTDDGRHFADNAVGWLGAAGQKSVSVKKLAAEASASVLNAAQVAAGPDGRISKADQARLAADLMEDIRALQGASVGPVPSPSANDVVAKLTAAVMGMQNWSESESPVLAFDGGPLGAANVTAQLVATRAAALFAQHGDALAGGGRVVDVPPLAEQEVSAGDPYAFLQQRATVHEWDEGNPDAEAYAAKWAALSATVAQGLSDLQLFRFGTVEATYVLVGRTPSGALAGFMTGAVET